VGIVSFLAITACQASQPSGSSARNTSGAPYVIMDNVKQPGQHLYVPASRYVALGDSFSSGEGTPWFWPETDKIIPKDTCHRSDRAYSQILGTIDKHPGVPKPDHADFVACSGAQIQALFVDNVDNGSELPQQNRLDDNVGLVTMTMSGNNVGFGPILSDCVTSLDPRVEAALSVFSMFYPPILSHGTGQCRDRNQSQLDINLNWIDGTRSDSQDNPNTLEKVYLALRNQAPKARILILGYPHEFQQNPTDSCQSINPGDQSWSNTQLVDRLNAVIKRNIDAANIDTANKAAEVPIEYLDTVQPFLAHTQSGGGCGAAHVSAFNGIWDIDQLGEDYQGLFHPNEYGHQILAQVVLDRLMQPAPPGLPPVSIRRPPPPAGDCTSDTFLQAMRDQGATVTGVSGPPTCSYVYAEQDFTFAPGPTSNYPTFFFHRDSSLPLTPWKLLGGGAIGDASSICRAMPANVRAAFTLPPGSDSGCPAG
jgi:GDSL-like Lipase/Acylhydrolase family